VQCGVADVKAPATELRTICRGENAEAAFAVLENFFSRFVRQEISAHCVDLETPVDTSHPVFFLPSGNEKNNLYEQRH